MCIDWGYGNEMIYSGSSDQHIVEWNIGTGHETQYVSRDTICVILYAVVAAASGRLIVTLWSVCVTMAMGLSCSALDEL